MTAEKSLASTERRHLDHILELDLDWKAERLESGRLRLAPLAPELPPHGSFRRSRRRASEVSEGAPALREAEARLAAGDYREARRLLDGLLRREPRDAWALAWRAEARRALGNKKGARADLDRALALAPEEPGLLVLSARLGRPKDLDRALRLEPGFFWALVHRGWARLRAGRPREAAEDLSSVLREDSRCGWALFWRSHAHEQAGEVDLARRDRAAALLLDQSTIWSHHPLTGGKLNRNDWLQALEASEARLAADPEDAAGYALRADARDQHDLVVADLKRAIALEPGRAWFHGLLARVLVYAGSVEEASQAMARAIKLWPSCGWFYAWRGEVRRRQGRLADAARDQTRAIRIDAADPRAYAWRGAVKRLSGDLAGALEDLGKALALDPDYAAWILNERRHARWQLKDLEGAFADLDGAARRDLRMGFASAPDGRRDYAWALKTLDAHLRAEPDSAWGWAWKGEALLRTGRLKEARAALERALRSSPELALPRLWSAELAFAQGRFAACRRDLERALALEPRLAWAYALRAELAAREGRLAAAAEDLELFRHLCVKDCGATLYRARLLRRAGKLSEALALCGRVIALNPTDAWAYQERVLVRLALGDPAGARADQRLAESHEARQPWVFGMAGRVLAELPERRDYALGELTRDGRGAPSAFWKAAWKGQLQLRAGRLEEAERARAAAERLAPKGARELSWVWALKGEEAVRRGRAAEAARAFDRALALDGEEPAARLGRARLRESRGDLAGALADVAKASDGQPLSAWLWHWRGRLQLSLGRFQEAEKDLSQALEIHPEYAEALCARGLTRQGLGRFDEQLADFKKAAALDPERFGALRQTAGAR